ncbi:MAG: hypothetical protein M3326_01160 [Actinomycetota bacterium]|nr:hypothetical protein [Actinomycetota bacterium]
MPWTVAVASALQIATAGTFVVMTVLALRYGGEGQHAAEEAVTAQGLPGDLLARGRVNFRESTSEAGIPIAIAAVLVALAALNLASVNIGRVLSWAVQPILMLLGGFVTGSQVFAIRQLKSAFARSGDDELARIDVERTVAAAVAVFPRWFRPMVLARFLLVTAGSALVIVLLAVPMSSSHY